MARKMEIRPVRGLADVLRAEILTNPDSRMFQPRPEALVRVTQIGNAFIKRAAEMPENEGATVYAAYQWPNDGPIHLALIWAVNTRHPRDAKTGGDLFFRAYTETQETTEHLLSVDQMEEELCEYAAAQFGKPRAVTPS